MSNHEAIRFFTRAFRACSRADGQASEELLDSKTDQEEKGTLIQELANKVCTVCGAMQCLVQCETRPFIPIAVARALWGRCGGQPTADHAQLLVYQWTPSFKELYQKFNTNPHT